jgi:hypothetical protein
MKKVLIIAVFVFTTMSFTDVNTTNDKITTEVDCVTLAANVQAAMEANGSDMEAANWFANLVYELCLE